MEMDLPSLLRALSGVRCVVIGDAILDVWVRGTAVGLCREAPAPAVAVRSTSEAPGGAANAVVNAAMLGAAAELVTVTGADAAATALAGLTRARGVGLGGHVRVAGRTTLVRRRVVAGAQIVVRLDEGSAEAPGADVHDSLLTALGAALEPAGGPAADALLISDNGHGTVPRADAVRWPGRPPVVVVDARDPSAHAALEPTVTTPSYLDAVRMVAETPVDGPADRRAQIGDLRDVLLLASGAGAVLVTLGADGAMLLEWGRAPHHVPARVGVPHEVVGAGNVLAAALTCALGVGAPPAVAAGFGVLVAGTAAAGAGSGADAPGYATAVCNIGDVRDGLRVERGAAGGADLTALLGHWRQRGRRIVFTNGCFDLVHEGHVRFLRQAKALGDVLVVGVNDDESVRELKGSGRPVVDLAGRLELLGALDCVDLVVAFSGPTPAGLLQIVRPDVYAKGGDYRGVSFSYAPLLRALGTEVRILDYVADRSTSSMIARAAIGE
jgi:D-beta-D-heptose 7-phosphate kinase / D-beta-D-heptose 1-phosphate adenosyltransferase